MINHKPREVSPKCWVEAVVFLTAYFPLFLILFILDVSVNTVGLPIGPSVYGNNVSVWALGLLFTSSAASLFSAVLMRKNLTYQQGGNSIQVTNAVLLRGDMLNYTLPFLIGLFAFDYSNWQNILSLLVFLFFMFAFVVKDRIILLNPMFLLMGIRLYKMTYHEVGSNSECMKTVLCLGELKSSDDIVYTKKSAGIEFVYPEKITRKGP
jgi:hypothetical protein